MFIFSCVIWLLLCTPSSFAATSVTDFINSYNFADDHDRQNPDTFMVQLNNYLHTLDKDHKISAILETDEQGNNGVMAFINARIAGGGNGKNLFTILDCLPNDILTLKQAFMSLNKDNQSALSLAFKIGDYTTQFALSRKIGKNHDILREKDKNRNNFVFKAMTEDLDSFFLPWGGMGFRTLVIDDPTLAQELLLEEGFTNIGISNTLTYATLAHKYDLLRNIFENFNLYSTKTAHDIVLHQDKNNENILMYAAVAKTPADVVVMLLKQVNTYDELTKLLLIKEKSGNLSAIVAAMQKNNIAFLKLAFQALHCLAQKKSIDPRTPLTFKEILASLRLLLIENKKTWVDEQLIPAAIAIIKHYSPDQNPESKLPEILEKVSSWITENRSILDQLNRDQLVEFFKQNPQTYPSSLTMQLAVLKNSLVKLKEKLEQLKTKLVNLKTEIIL